VKVRAFIIRATIDALGGRVDEALALLDEVERRFPFADPAILAAYHHARGNALTMRGAFAEAERELDTSRTPSPTPTATCARSATRHGT
jgi:hypothetical protein